MNESLRDVSGAIISETPLEGSKVIQLPPQNADEVRRRLGLDQVSPLHHPRNFGAIAATHNDYEGTMGRTSPGIALKLNRHNKNRFGQVKKVSV